MYVFLFKGMLKDAVMVTPGIIWWESVKVCFFFQSLDDICPSYVISMSICIIREPNLICFFFYSAFKHD